MDSEEDADMGRRVVRNGMSYYLTWDKGWYMETIEGHRIGPFDTWREAVKSLEVNNG